MAAGLLWLAFLSLSHAGIPTQADMPADELAFWESRRRGANYELGAAPLGAAYWEAVKRGLDPKSLERRGPNPLLDVLARRLDRNQGSQQYGRPNPNAPPQLSRFAFLIGTWRCESRVKGQDGTYTSYDATWVGRYILDGYVIADEFRQVDAEGATIQLGQTFRSYDIERGVWEMRWLDALNSTWLELGPEDLGGVTVTDTAIIFKHGRPPGLEDLLPAHAIFRTGFYDISEDRFTWRAEISTDGQRTWEEVQVIEARRVRD